MFGSKDTAILVNRGILPSGGVASGRVCVCAWKSYLKAFGHGGAVNLWEEEDHRLTDLIN